MYQIYPICLKISTSDFARVLSKDRARFFCCGVDFHRWRYGFESLPPAVMNKTTTISKENSGEGDIFSPAVYYRFSKNFKKKEGIFHEHHYRHRPRLLCYQNSPLFIPGWADKLRRTRTLPQPRTLRVWRVLFCLWLRAAAYPTG